MTVLSGTLKTPTGDLLSNAYIVLVSKRNTIAMISGLHGEYLTGADGTYSFTVAAGDYDVFIRQEKANRVYSGSITVSADSTNGSLNSYLVSINDSDISSEVMAQVVQYLNLAQKAAEDAKKYQTGTIYINKKMSVTSSLLINAAEASEFIVTLNSTTCAITISGAIADAGISQQLSLKLIQGTGSNDVTWPSSVKWPHGYKPRLSYELGQMDLITLTTDDKGETWVGILATAGVK